MKPTTINPETRALCLRIVPVTGASVRLTQYPRDLTMSNGAVYLSAHGYQFTGLALGTTVGGAGAIDLTGVLGLSGVGRDQIESGQFDNARCYLFAVDMFAPIEDHEPIALAILGRTHLLDERYKIEEMTLLDALGQSVGATYTPQCPKRFGGQEFAGCKVVASAHQVTGTITSVSGAGTFVDSALAVADGWANAGEILFTSGANAGLRIPGVKLQIGTTVELFEPPYFPLAVGDAYTLTAGCDKSLTTCRDKFSNVVNFGGFAYVPTSATYQAVAGLAR